MHSSLCACRTEVFVRHAFISENDDDCHGSSHSSGWSKNEYLRIEASVIEWKTVIIALIHEEQQSSSPPTMGFRDSCRRRYNMKRVECHEVQ
ncbi:hypothetical protein U6S72_12330, partial [Cutibacterium acnes]